MARTADGPGTEGKLGPHSRQQRAGMPGHSRHTRVLACFLLVHPHQVYLSSQCIRGELRPELYRSGSVALALGAEGGPKMTPEAAVVKMMLCLANTELSMTTALAGEMGGVFVHKKTPGHSTRLIQAPKSNGVNPSSNSSSSHKDSVKF